MSLLSLAFEQPLLFVVLVAVFLLVLSVFEQPLLFVVLVAVFLLVLSVHEFSHALVGYWLGDSTAQRMGRLTLNPLAHIDPIGFLALLTIGFGWGKPVPFNPYNLKYPRWGPTLVALAGPGSNLILGAIFAVLFRFFAPLLGGQNLLIVFLSYAAYLNFLLLLFNLIPIPPLDGSKVLLSVLDGPRYAPTRFFLERYGVTVLLTLILLDSFSSLSIFSWLSIGAQGLFRLIGG
ncbi:site-2 protease family protein [Candidatus Uhrbacteria bacterium]|nr:site-2 protease family protein [Candidatus Uhrbacteria bacterium]